MRMRGKAIYHASSAAVLLTNLLLFTFFNLKLIGGIGRTVFRTENFIMMLLAITRVLVYMARIIMTICKDLTVCNIMVVHWWYAMKETQVEIHYRFTGSHSQLGKHGHLPVVMQVMYEVLIFLWLVQTAWNALTKVTQGPQKDRENSKQKVKKMAVRGGRSCKCTPADYLEQLVIDCPLRSGRQPVLWVYAVPEGNHPLHDESMCYERLRFASFNQCPNLPDFVTQLAGDGFFAEDNRTLCFACGSDYPNHSDTCARRSASVPFSVSPPPLAVDPQAASGSTSIEEIATEMNFQLRHLNQQETGGLAEDRSTSRGGRPSRCPDVNHKHTH